MAITTIARAQTKRSTTLPRFIALSWSLDSLVNNSAWRRDNYWIGERAKQHLYSFRMLRYWYMERLLVNERQRLGRALSVLEIGVDRGQMKAFVDGATVQNVRLYSQWDAADICPQPLALTESGYHLCHTINLDDANSLADFIEYQRAKYDVVIVLHVLEHLHMPERAVSFLVKTLKSEGIMLGGFPVIPDTIVDLREKQLQKNAATYGHVSAFSPERIRKMAANADLNVDYASGAFAVRASGSPLEHCAWWLRLNVAFGAALPAWPGEIYWQLRNTAA
jgi:SAM-dependent methyltransferase